MIIIINLGQTTRLTDSQQQKQNLLTSGLLPSWWTA